MHMYMYTYIYPLADSSAEVTRCILSGKLRKQASQAGPRDKTKTKTRHPGRQADKKTKASKKSSSHTSLKLKTKQTPLSISHQNRKGRLRLGSLDSEGISLRP